MRAGSDMVYLLEMSSSGGAVCQCSTSRIRLMENRLDSLSPLEGSKPPVASDSKASTSTCYRSCMIKKGRCLVTTPDDDVPSRDQDLKIEPDNHNPVGLSAIVIMPMMVLVIKHAFSSCTWCHCHKVQMPVAKKKHEHQAYFFACRFICPVCLNRRLTWFTNSIHSKIRNIMEHPLRRTDVQCKE